MAAAGGLGFVAFTAHEPLTFVVFPALVWAALRFGPPGVTLSIAIAAGAAIGFTASELGPFAEQSIDDKTLSTQVFIAVAALTSLFLSALVSERERSISELAEARRETSERALEERHRIARELHDSVSQALFSTILQTRTAKLALDAEGASESGKVGRGLTAIEDITLSAQREMRALLFELNRGDEGELVFLLMRHASELGAREGLVIEVEGPPGPLRLSPEAQSQLFAIGREALANVVRHSSAPRAWVRVEAGLTAVSLEVRDHGSGFDTAAGHPGHYGLESMRTRAADLGGTLTIRSRPGEGTVVRVDAPVTRPEAANDV